MKDLRPPELLLQERISHKVADDFDQVSLGNEYFELIEQWFGAGVVGFNAWDHERKYQVRISVEVSAE